MSVRRLSLEVHIALRAAEAEAGAALRLGASERDAIAAYYFVFDEILRIARRPDV